MCTYVLVFLYVARWRHRTLSNFRVRNFQIFQRVFCDFFEERIHMGNLCPFAHFAFATRMSDENNYVLIVYYGSNISIKPTLLVFIGINFSLCCLPVKDNLSENTNCFCLFSLYSHCRICRIRKLRRDF